MGRRPVLVALGTGALLLGLTVLLPGVRDGIALGAGVVARPIGEVGSALGRTLTGWWPAARSQELAALRERNGVLTATVSQLSTQLQEVRELGALRASLGSDPLPTITARILLRGSDPAIQTITLDRGSAHGVQEGAAVLAAGGFLLGRVHGVGPRTAQVLLLTDPTSRTTVQIGTVTTSLGVVIGDQGTSAVLTNVRRDTPLDIGHAVVTAGIDAGVPRGIPVGTLGAITTQPADLFQSATVLLPAQERPPVVVLVVGVPAA